MRNAVARKDLRVSVGKRLAEARELAGMTQLQAAAAIGQRNSTQISLWEKGRRACPPVWLLKLAALYSVSLDWLNETVTVTLKDPAPPRPPAKFVRPKLPACASVSDVLRGTIKANPGISSPDLYAYVCSVRPGTKKSLATTCAKLANDGQIQRQVERRNGRYISFMWPVRDPLTVAEKRGQRCDDLLLKAISFAKEARAKSSAPARHPKIDKALKALAEALI